MRIIRVKAAQGHAVPSKAYNPQGPFPPELRGFNPGYAEMDEYGGADVHALDRYEEDASPSAQPQIVVDYEPEYPQDGSNFEPGATAQNNFRPEKHYRCRHCEARLLEHELDEHECED